MITIPQVIEELVKASPFLEEGLSLGIINLSALARKFKPEIEEKLVKEVQTGAIIMALSRLEEKLQKTLPQTVLPPKNFGDLTVRSNLVELSFTNSPTLIDKQRELLLAVNKTPGAFLNSTHGSFETTLILSSNLQTQAQKIFDGECLNSKFTKLSSITIILPKKNVYQPGVYYQILKALAWEGINIIEIVSNTSDLTIILENNLVDKAFTVLKNLTT